MLRGAAFKKSIEFLRNYVDKHFSEEEELQRNHGYPDNRSHREIHENYRAAMKKLTVEWMAAGPSKEISREVRKQVGNWLISHIKAQDVKIGAYIRSKFKTAT